MSGLVKYRVHEVAKDFGVNSKDITELVAKYYPGAKSHMTTLEDRELNIIFEAFTKAHTVSDLQAYFVAAADRRNAKQQADTPAEPAPAPAPAEPERKLPGEAYTENDGETVYQAAPAPKPQPQQARSFVPGQRPQQGGQFQNNNRPQQGGPNNRPQQGGQFQNNNRPQQGGQNNNRPQQGGQPNGQRPQQGGQFQPNRPQQAASTPKPQPQQAPQQQGQRRDGVRVVNTRGNSVDLSKYDEHLDTLVPESHKDVGAGKQKFKKNNNRPQPGTQRRESEADKLKRLELEKARRAPVHLTIPDALTVGELASRLKKTSGEVVKKLMMMGTMCGVNETIDFDTAALIAEEFGAVYEREVTVTIEEKLIDDAEDKAEDLVTRPPVVVVMGHVDHGKTSLLDAIRNTHVTAGEAGGITQHIGAYKIVQNGREITFLDTPGHAAFTEMRARGANVTDIVILVVAADDGIMPQTIEAINHAKAANVPIIVAINKMDKPEANPDRIKQQLTEHGLVPEEWGGDIICMPVSAMKHDGIDELLEMLLLTADVQELKANPDRMAKGTVVEARLDKGRGPVATMLVQNGTLKSGDILIAGTAVGRVRAMTDDTGRRIHTAGPSTPVEIIGLAEVPAAGDLFHAVSDEKMARELAEQRRQAEQEEKYKSAGKVSLDDLFSQIQQGNIKDFNIIVKADVQGSVEAVRQSLEKLSNDEVKVRVIHGGVGAISESDLMLASASNALIIGFNVRPDANTRDNAARQNIEIRTYRVIYECLEEVEAAMKGMLAPKFRENILGHAEVRLTYKVSGVGTIAGCYVQDGKIQRNAQVRVLRDSVVVAESRVESLKRFKDDAKEVAAGYECGMGLEKFNDIKEGDIFEAYVMEEYKD